MSSPWMCQLGSDGKPACVNLGPGQGVFATQADCDEQCLGYWMGRPRWQWYLGGGVIASIVLLVLFGLYELVRHAPAVE